MTRIVFWRRSCRWGTLESPRMPRGSSAFLPRHEAGTSPVSASMLTVAGTDTFSRPGRRQMDGTAEALARYAAGLQFEDLTDGAIHGAKRSIVDSFGCA